VEARLVCRIVRVTRRVRQRHSFAHHSLAASSGACISSGSSFTSFFTVASFFKRGGTKEEPVWPSRMTTPPERGDDGWYGAERVEERPSEEH
jgi:hypothetical protein